MAIDPVAPATPVSPARAVGGSPELATALSALARAALVSNAAALGQIAGTPTANPQTPGDAVAPVADARIATPEGEHAVAPPAPSPAAEPSAGDRLSSAVRFAAAQAAPVQSGLASTMADVEAVIARPDTPQAVRQAARAVLDSALPTRRPVSSADVRGAVQGSGVFFEANLARTALAGVATAPSASGDLKAALLVFRAVVSTWLADTPGSPPSAPQGSAPTTLTPTPAGPSAGLATTYTSSGQISSGVQPDGPAVASRPVAAGATGMGAPQPTMPGAPSPDLAARAPRVLPGAPSAPSPVPSANPVPVDGAETAPERMLQSGDPDAVASPLKPGPAPAMPPRPFLPVGLIEDERVAPLPPPEREDPAVHRDGGSAATGGSPRGAARPPPPYAGGPTSPQAVALSDLAEDLAPHDVARRLLKSVDGAIARQELSQIASLPEPRADPERSTETKGSRWVFDLPFQTPQGVAVAQFEISRDGGGGGSSDSGREIERTWRARFSLDVEPLGPVHVQIALTGALARVGLWAERPEAMARLHAGEADLSAALREAELTSEVAVHAGVPTIALTAPGRFVDRAS